MNKILLVLLSLIIVGCNKVETPIGNVDKTDLQTTIMYLNHKYENNIHACRLYYEYKIVIPLSECYSCGDEDHFLKYLYRTSRKLRYLHLTYLKKEYFEEGKGQQFLDKLRGDAKYFKKGFQHIYLNVFFHDKFKFTSDDIKNSVERDIEKFIVLENEGANNTKFMKLFVQHLMRTRINSEVNDLVKKGKW